MRVKLKPISEQVMVITGASSGIGLATARRAANAGAKVVLAARNERALSDACEQLSARGAQVNYVITDVSTSSDAAALADRAVELFGPFDTWVNNAGTAIYGRIDAVPIEDAQALFDTNFWGTVHGSLAAIKVLRAGQGGALINLGSALSDRAVPLQGFYAASKHAVKGFTDALRMELEQAGTPISVTLIKPTAMNTMYPDHATNYMPERPTLPPPVYDPEIVAKAIIHAAQHPARDIFVGGAAKALSAAAYFAPRLTDRYMEWTMFDQQKSNRPPATGRRNNLREAGTGGRERGTYPGRVLKSSMYTELALRPKTTLVSLAALAAGSAALVAWGRRAR